VIASRVERATRQPSFPDWVSGACLLIRRADLERPACSTNATFSTPRTWTSAPRSGRTGGSCASPRSRSAPRARRFARHGAGPAEHAYRRSQLAFYRKHHPFWAPVWRRTSSFGAISRYSNRIVEPGRLSGGSPSHSRDDGYRPVPTLAAGTARPAVAACPVASAPAGADSSSRVQPTSIADDSASRPWAAGCRCSGSASCSAPRSLVSVEAGAGGHRPPVSRPRGHRAVHVPAIDEQRRNRRRAGGPQPVKAPEPTITPPEPCPSKSW
jgi:hypothetical protein